MKSLTRLAVLSLLVPALVLPSTGAASAKAADGGDGALCWLLDWDCEHDERDEDDADDDEGTTMSAPTTLIQGVAVDSDGKGIDNVSVQALDAATGAPVATALTYASARADGPQHGYFYLHVDRGVYDVVLVKRGYDASFLQDVNVPGSRRVSLGQLALSLRDWPTRTVAEVLDPVVTPAQRVLVSVEVDSRKAKVTDGRVLVTEGRRTLASEKLAKADRGRLTVDLGRLPRGSHQLAVQYRGVDGLKSSASKTLKVTVAKPSAKQRVESRGGAAG